MHAVRFIFKLLINYVLYSVVSYLTVCKTPEAKIEWTAVKVTARIIIYLNTVSQDQ